MRRASTLVLAVLGALLVAPVDAHARPGIRLGGIVGVIASPLRALGGAARRAHISSHHRRSAHSHARGRTTPREPRDVVATARPARPAPDLRRTGLQIWPTAFEEALGYAIAPDDYGERFWSHGYGDVIDAIMASPPSALAPGGRTASRHQRRRTVRADGGNRAGSPSQESCREFASSGAGLTARMLETIALSEPQRRTFEEFRTAFVGAMEKIKAACRDDAPLSPPARLQSLEDGLMAAQYAELHVRGPLAKFYESLTEAQKAQFERRASRIDRTGSGTEVAQAADLPADGHKSCGMREHQAADRLIGRIEQELRPSESQRPSLEALRGISLQLDRYLTTSCPQTAASDPLKRLEAAGDRITDILYAVQSTRQVLSGFLATLNDDQMKRFSVLTQ